MNKGFEVSIIVVNYKVMEKLLNCINSINSSKLNIPFEVIVVDNEGDESLEKELKKHAQIKYIKSNKNIGFGAGNNLGAKHASGKYLFFLNPDTRIASNTIDQLYKFIKSSKNVGIVSPMLVDSKFKFFSTQSRKELTPLNVIYSFSFLRKVFKNKSIYHDPFFNKWNKKIPIEVETIPGAALMISKKLFEKVKGFDEQFFLYFEENDLSNRIRNLGYKLYIVPKSIVIHEVGQSTKKIVNIENIFNKSRFLYLKKNYGIIKAILTELILRINKMTFILFIILLSSLYLRTVNLDISMPFIGDQGWFYLSARDLLIHGQIPLVGITSSHLWLHQGPLWTYMLSFALLLGNFNPISGAYLTAALGVGSTFLMYKLGSKMFSKEIGIIASFLYAVSPLIVFFERMPFDPSVVPFFTILYFYSVFRWITGSLRFFLLSLFFIAVLYNLELATFTLSFPLILFFIYGIIKNKIFVKKLLNLKAFFYSIIFLIIPMIPVLIYDFSNEFKQTVIFLGWVFIYKPFSFLLNYSQNTSGFNIGDVISFLLINVQKILFQSNFIISIVIFASSLFIVVKSLFKKRNLALENSKLLLMIFLTVGVTGIIFNKTPSDAYLPILFPFLIYITAILFDYLLNIKIIKYFILLCFILIICFNFYFSYKNTFNPELSSRIKATNKIIEITKGNSYNLIGKGEGSWFESFTMNYEYLLWWKGYPPSKNSENLKIIIKEDNTGISVYRL